MGYSGKDAVTDITTPRPLLSATGYAIRNTYLPLTGLDPATVAYATTLRCRWRHTPKLPPKPDLLLATQHCTTHHFTIPPTIRVIVALGQEVVTFTQGERYPIGEWRGYILPHLYQGVPVYAVVDPLHTFADPIEKLNARSDWTRLRHYLAGTWPLPMPVRGTDQWIVCPTDRPVSYGIIRAAQFRGQPNTIAFIDTEYHYNERHPWESVLTILGIAFRAPYQSPVIIQFDWSSLSSEERDDVRRMMIDVVAKCRVGAFNLAADLPVIEHNLAIPQHTFTHTFDPMLLHAVLWPELPHNEGYLASLYGRHEKLKHLMGADIFRYNAGDLLEPLHIWDALLHETTRRPESRTYYDTHMIPLVNIHTYATKRGIAVNRDFVYQGFMRYADTITEAATVARAAVGFPLNIGSNEQLVRVLTTLRTYNLRRGRGTQSLTINKDAIAALRSRIKPAPDLEREADAGLSFAEALERIEVGADPVLEMRVVYGSALQTVAHYLTPLLLHPPKGKDALETLFAAVDLVGREGPDAIRSRVHPRIATHTQAWLRWSTTDPPMATLPDDLEMLYGPDPGCVWFGWDWSGQEDWLQAAEANDVMTLTALREGQDLHTIKTRELFGIPPGIAIDKKDPRRIFTKQYRHRRKYGGTVQGLATMPGVKELGLNVATLQQMMTREATINPAFTQWQQRIIASVAIKPHALYYDIPTWTGRMRRTLEKDGRRVRVAMNAAQGGGVDMLNITIINLHRELGHEGVQIAYTAHDSGVLHIPETIATPETFERIAAIVEAPHHIWGHTISVPATYWVRHSLTDFKREWTRR